MDEMKIEWVDAALDLCDIPHDLKTAVVRLDAVDQVLTEAVWAMEITVHYMKLAGFDERSDSIVRAQAFLASPAVTDFKERREAKKAKPIPDSEDDSTDWAHLDRDER